MTFSVKQYVADHQLEPYPFEDIDGVTRHLPNLYGFATGEVEQLLHRLDTNPVAAMCELVDDETAEAIRATPLGALLPLIEDWRNHSTAAPGESAASSGSSKSTARPSKSTSRASTRAKTRKR